jgi:CHASE2 domain-containing sensor protein
MNSVKPWLRARFSRDHYTLRTLRRDLTTVGWTLLGAAGFVLTFLLIHIPDGPQHWSSDLVTAYFSRHPETQRNDIALIYVTDMTLQSLPYTSPVDRKLLASVVRAADNAGVKAIGLDFVFDRHSETLKDDELNAAIRDARAPIVIGGLDQRSVESPEGIDYQLKFIAGTNRPVGHLYFDERRSPFIISDHVVRAIAPSNEQESYRQSFAEALAKASGSARELRSPQISWLLAPNDGSEIFTALSAEQLLGTGKLREALPLKQLIGRKIVIIGGNFDDRDQHLTPLSVLGGAHYPGVSIHAQVLAQILDGRSAHVPGMIADAAMLAVIVVFGFWIGRRDIADRYHRAIETTGAISLVLLSIFCFLLFDFLFPFTLLFIGGMVGVVGGHYSKQDRN